MSIQASAPNAKSFNPRIRNELPQPASAHRLIRPISSVAFSRLIIQELSFRLGSLKLFLIQGALPAYCKCREAKILEPIAQQQMPHDFSADLER
jgi:hypothetical protein